MTLCSRGLIGDATEAQSPPEFDVARPVSMKPGLPGGDVDCCDEPGDEEADTSNDDMDPLMDPFVDKGE